jgi:uncharacterized protein with PIN domain
MMAGEKAQENKTLTSVCAGCGKTLSTELLHGVVVGRARQRRMVAICQACRDKGWTPEASGTPSAA